MSAIIPASDNSLGDALFGFAEKRKNRAAAREIYRRIVARAREPVFFADWAVPDTLDGRFELIALHVCLVLRRLKREPDAGDAGILAQALFDTMFGDMDENLRELGVGDLSVGKHVKAMARALYGRLEAYDAGLDGEQANLEDALRRNLFGTAPDAEVAPMSAYVRCVDRHLADHEFGPLAAGRVDFGPPPGAQRDRG